MVAVESAGGRGPRPFKAGASLAAAARGRERADLVRKSAGTEAARSSRKNDKGPAYRELQGSTFEGRGERDDVAPDEMAEAVRGGGGVEDQLRQRKNAKSSKGRRATAEAVDRNSKSAGGKRAGRRGGRLVKSALAATTTTEEGSASQRSSELAWLQGEADRPSPSATRSAALALSKGQRATIAKLDVARAAQRHSKVASTNQEGAFGEDTSASRRRRAVAARTRRRRREDERAPRERLAPAAPKGASHKGAISKGLRASAADEGRGAAVAGRSAAAAAAGRAAAREVRAAAPDDADRAVRDAEARAVRRRRGPGQLRDRVRRAGRGGEEKGRRRRDEICTSEKESRKRMIRRSLRRGLGRQLSNNMIATSVEEEDRTPDVAGSVMRLVEEGSRECGCEVEAASTDGLAPGSWECPNCTFINEPVGLDPGTACRVCLEPNVDRADGERHFPTCVSFRLSKRGLVDSFSELGPEIDRAVRISLLSASLHCGDRCVSWSELTPDIEQAMADSLAGMQGTI